MSRQLITRQLVYLWRILVLVYFADSHLQFRFGLKHASFYASVVQI